MLFLFAALAAATPVCNSIEQNANFDDIPGSPLVLNTPVPMGYRGLYFQGFGVTQVIQTNLLPGVFPHSPTNYGDITAMTQTLQGTAMMTTNYPNSNTSSFSLESFYFGSVISAGNGAAAVPAATNIQATGYRGLDNQVTNAKQVCSHQYQYNPSTNLGAQQQAFSGRHL